MKFDIERWKTAALASSAGTVSIADLNKAAGLTDLDYLEADIEFLMRQIDEELGPLPARPTKKWPSSPRSA